MDLKADAVSAHRRSNLQRRAGPKKRVQNRVSFVSVRFQEKSDKLLRECCHVIAHGLNIRRPIGGNTYYISNTSTSGILFFCSWVCRYVFLRDSWLMKFVGSCIALREYQKRLEFIVEEALHVTVRL